MAMMDPLPKDLSGRLWALFQMPRIEGAGIFWRPVLLGHEVAHLAVTRIRRDLTIRTLLAI